MAGSILINSSHVVPGSNNSQFRYVFPPGSTNLDKKQIAVVSVAVYYCWFNLTSANNNSTFSYVWPSAAGSGTYTVAIADGFYSIDDLNAYWQNVMVANGHYLVSDTGAYVYYLEWTTNASKYAVQLNSYPIPATLPDGYSNPANLVFPNTTKTPQVVIPATKFRDVVGFNNATLPAAPQTTVYSKTSDYTPQVTPVQSLTVTCSLVRNNFSIPNNLVYQFGFEGTSFGGLINNQSQFPIFSDVTEGYHNQMLVQFFDQNLNPVVLQDPNVAVIFAIRDKP